MRHVPARNDVPPAGEAPKHVKNFLLKLGGWNPFGEPMLRIVLADHILQLRGGMWHDWPKGTPLSEQGGLVFSEEKQIVKMPVNGPSGLKMEVEVEMPREMTVHRQQPMRVVKEMRWIKRYPKKTGWMLQMWEPASRYAPRTWWESHTVPGAEDLLVLGPFPDRGAYEPFAEWMDVDAAGNFYHSLTWPEIPGFDKMETGYGMMIQDRNNMHSANADWRRLTRMIEWRAQEEAQEQKDHEENKAILRDRLKPIFSSSLEAGRIREALAQRARERGVEMGHVGN